MRESTSIFHVGWKSKTFVRRYVMKRFGYFFCIVAPIWAGLGFAQANVWRPLNGPSSGQIFSLLTTPDNVLFAGAGQPGKSGIFKTLDGGNTWTQVESGECISLGIDSTGTLYAGMYSAIYRSTDGGDTWNPMLFPFNIANTSFWDIKIDSNGGIYLAGAGTGVYKSANAGITWEKLSTGLNNLDLRSLAINASGHLFAGTWGGGVFRSTDDGAHWAPINTGLTDFNVRCLAISPNGDIYAGTTTGAYRSMDNGDHWKSTGSPIEGKRVTSIAVNKTNGYIYASTDEWEGLYRSVNKGFTWTKFNSGGPGSSTVALAFDGNGYLYFGSFFGTVYRTVKSTLGSNYGPQIAFNKTSFSFTADSSASPPPAQALSIQNLGKGILDWSAGNGTTWMKMTPATGLLAQGSSSPVTVGINTTALMPGLYQDTILVSSASADNSPQIIPVAYTVQALPRIVLNPPAMVFEADSGTGRLEQSLTISNSEGGTLKWNIQNNQPWLTVAPDSGLGNDASVLVKIASTDLLPGVYQDTLRILGVKSETGNNAVNSPQLVPVTFTVDTAETQIVIDKETLLFIADSGRVIPTKQSFLIDNPGTGTIQWIAVKSQPWINISPDGGTGNNSRVTVSILNTDLDPGTYQDTVEITGSRVGTGQIVLRSPQKITVTYVVGTSAVLAISKSIMNFGEVDSGMTAPPQQSFLITNQGGGTLQWSIFKEQNWFRVNPMNGATNDSVVTVAIAETRLPPGSYSDTLIVSGTKTETGYDAVHSPLRIAVNFNVGARARLETDIAELSFDADSGSGLPDFLKFRIFNTGAGMLRWSVSKSQAWLRVGPDAGISNSVDIDARVMSTNLAPGTYRDTITIAGEKIETGSSASNSPLLIAVRYRVYALPKIALSSQELSFIADSGNVLPGLQKVVVNNAGEGTLQWNATRNQPWLDVQPTEGSSNGDTVTISVTTTNLPKGVYADIIMVTSPNAVNSPRSIKVTYRIVVNHPPASFTMLVPSVKDTVIFMTVPPVPLGFHWQATTDPDPGDSLLYALRVRGSGLDTLVSGLKDTRAALDIMNRLQIGSTYFCWVTATDGWAMVSSDTMKFVASAQITGVEEAITDSPNEFILLQNYPNPFNPTTTIIYGLPCNSHVFLEIYNALGQRIALLFDGDQNAGYHEVRFDGSNLTSGVFFYRLRAGGFVKMKRLLLMR
jgi:photosystem II stability/assembly factor-like uncharacterized protein